jgi:aminomuconate-semialdehyde/2-hydroxymuconate-6-semialdehyde dehydrogenase
MNTNLNILNFINGELARSTSGELLENIEPRTGTVYSTLPRSNAADVEQAVEAASTAFTTWKNTTKEQRSEYLLELARLIRENAEELILAEARDNGKPVKLASQVDIPRAAANFEYFAKLIVSDQGMAVDSRPDMLHYTRPAPLGVVACISPWNLPLYLLTWKIAPALAAGNTVVAKPSEVTPMTAYLLSKLVQKSSLPQGVLNIVHGLGTEVGVPLVTHPKVKAVSFTGSTATGETISKLVAGTFKKLSLEMGGKNPTIIFPDADLIESISHGARASFANQGQICLCGSRILIHEDIYETVRDGLIARAKSLVIGDPLDARTQHGALVSKEHFEKVASFIERARQDGATILCGGETPKLPGELAGGYFLAPTLIEGLDATHQLNQEEIFGPVATLIPFKTEEEALAIANGTIYGLAASVWTNDLSRAHRMARDLEAGMVWLNCWMERDLNTPFGGVKASGVGREGGKYALDFFREQKSIGLKISETNL